MGATTARDGHARWALASTLAGVALLAVLVLAIPALRHAVGEALQGHTDELRGELRGLGVGGGMIVLALCTVHAILWYPSEIVNAAAGFVYGFWLALPLVMAGWMINALITWWLGGLIARPVLMRFAGSRRVEDAERMIDGGGATLLISVRLVPVVPFSLTGYVAGAARVPLWRFMWTSAVGFLPMTAIFTYFGSRLESFSATDPLILALVGVVVLLLLGARRILRASRLRATG
jgi:uncharacterized membrane protein YdjX (TVP38/TMEM64 family)